MGIQNSSIAFFDLQKSLSFPFIAVVFAPYGQHLCSLYVGPRSGIFSDPFNVDELALLNKTRSYFYGFIRGLRTIYKLKSAFKIKY